MTFCEYIRFVKKLEADAFAKYRSKSRFIVLRRLKTKTKLFSNILFHPG
jgi:hypothetical protein